MTVPSGSPLNYPTNAQPSLKRVVQNRAPTSNDYKNFREGDEWLDKPGDDWWKLADITGTVATWVKIGGTAGAVESFIPDSGTSPVVPNASNEIIITGGDGTQVVGSLNTLTIGPDENGYPITPYVVGPSGQAGYQTVQSAIDAASAAGGGVIGIQPGTYSEDITLPPDVHLIGLVGESGNIGLTVNGGSLLPVNIIGNVTLDYDSAPSTVTAIFENIFFSCTSGALVTIEGNLALGESCYVTFFKCTLLGDTGGSEIFSSNGFNNLNVDSCSIKEGTANQIDLFTFGATAFMNARFRSTDLDINAVNANSFPDGAFVTLTFENCYSTVRIDSSTGTQTLNVTATDCFFVYTASSSGDPLINFGANDGSLSVYNSTILDGPGALADSTNVSAAAFFVFKGCTWNNPLVLGANGRGDYTDCLFDGGSSSAFTMSSTQDVSFTNCSFVSSNNPCIAGSGTGTITFTNISFTNDENIAGTLTYTGGVGQAGSYNVNSTGDPTVTFNALGDTTFNHRIDNGNSLYQIRQASNVVLQSTTDGEITKPLTPAFLARSDPATAQDNVTGNGTIYTVLYPNEVFDIGGNFSSPAFTAPVDGTYCFNAGVYPINMTTSSTDVGCGFSFSTGAGGQWRGNGGAVTFAGPPVGLVLNQSCIIDLDAGDTCVLQITISGMAGDTVDIGVTSIYANYFSGYLLG